MINSTSSKETARIVPVILAGGSGVRLWPVSRPDCPKPFIKLDGALSLFQQTVKRCSEPELFECPIIVVGEGHRMLSEAQLTEIGVEPRAIIAEPCSRDTAAAIVIAAHYCSDFLRDSDLMAVFPSDQVIDDQDAFHAMVRSGRHTAQQVNRLVTFGITPTRAATEYGYIKRGRQLFGLPANKVASFIEKPIEDVAKAFLASGDYLWNSGMFLLPVRSFLRETAWLCPDLFLGTRNALSKAEIAGHIVRPNKQFFASVAKISIDYAVMELSSRVAVVPFECDWDDLGTWDAVAGKGEKDDRGNSTSGNVVGHENRNCHVHSRDRLTTVVGMEDCIVVSTKDAVLVTSKDRASELKACVQHMIDDQTPEVLKHPGEVRPWGRFAPLHNGHQHQVKMIEVNPGGRLSLQKHQYRAEHWIIVQGEATVTIDDEVQSLRAGGHVHIPLGAVHRLENFGSDPIVMIEVQTGTYFGEDDIIRLEDVYGRNRTDHPDAEKAAAA
ncbi:MAG: mannose-1-phosphate guanylyltransferase/mannose-6-phosphate isomerase [Pseudomonadota bacterium]